MELRSGGVVAILTVLATCGLLIVALVDVGVSDAWVIAFLRALQLTIANRQQTINNLFNIFFLIYFSI